MVQPLPFFRNWGPTVTMAGIHLAEKNEKARRWDTRQQLIAQMAAATSGYWDLVAAIYMAEVQRLALESGRNLLRINEIKLKNEVGTEIDVWEARAGVAQRENALIIASSVIGLAQDNLARLTRVNETPDWKIRMIPRDVPRYDEYPVDEAKFIAEAFEKRPDMQQARLMKDRAEIRRTVARNQRMPRLDAFGSYGVTGLGPNTGRASRNLGTGDYDNWALGLDFSFPIPNTRARAAARQADKLVEGSDLLTSKTADLATFEVRKAIRDLQTARQSIRVGETQVRSEREKLRGEMKRYEVGMATSQDLLDYQDRLASAQNTFIAAIVTYNKAIIDLERARGTLLDSLKVNVDAPAGEAARPAVTP
jgi:outer membrane protein TolC